MGMKRDAVIIGAGASGLMCAVEAGKRGRSVLVLDHGPKMGRKIRVSGGGRCNFTNLNIDTENYVSGNPHFCRSAISRFRPLDMVHRMEKHGIPFHEKAEGQLFCSSSSADMVRMLGGDCAEAGAEILLHTFVRGITHDGVFSIDTNKGVIQAQSVVIATGGLSYSSLGASGFGYGIARSFGLKVTTLAPSLVPFVMSGHERKFCRELSGISVYAGVSCGGKTFLGSILFTHSGLSGPACLQASLYWRKGDVLGIDLMPGMDVFRMLMAHRSTRVELRNFLSQHLPVRFCRLWTDLSIRSKPLNAYGEKELKTVAERLHNWVLMPEKTEGYEKAEVTLGGIDTSELSSKTMESVKIKGLYFIGEVVDVTGDLGGYNLHWAWASGFAAGQYI